MKSLVDATATIEAVIRKTRCKLLRHPSVRVIHGAKPSTVYQR